MPIVIDESDFIAHPTPAFTALAVGDIFKLTEKYYCKVDGSQAYSFIDAGLITIGGGNCYPVKAKLIITAP